MAEACDFAALSRLAILLFYFCRPSVVVFSGLFSPFLCLPSSITFQRLCKVSLHTFYFCGETCHKELFSERPLHRFGVGRNGVFRIAHSLSFDVPHREAHCCSVGWISAASYHCRSFIDGSASIGLRESLVTMYWKR